MCLPAETGAATPLREQSPVVQGLHVSDAGVVEGGEQGGGVLGGGHGLGCIYISESQRVVTGH